MTTEKSIILPNIAKDTSNYLIEITNALKVPRDIIASDEQIQYAWTSLPRVLTNIPNELITKWVVKMCIAVSCGLFDSWINYIWNEMISELRNKIKRFWLSIVGEITDKKDFDETKLNDLKDSELLTLVLRLNLITEEAFFHLDQCRDIRNYFSAAHPPIWELDEYELINFTNRCVKYWLSNETNPIWVNIWEFILSLKAQKYDDEQIKTWSQKLRATHEAQRELLFWTLYWIYCDPNSNEETRVNALNIYISLNDIVTPIIKSNLLESHQNYIIKWNKQSTYASQQFFEKIWNLELLWESERHAIIVKACKNLLDVHYAMNNFYNEPPFAERLYELTTWASVPWTAQERFVETVLICGMWNWYWISSKAFPYYKKLVSNFSPKEVDIALKLSENRNTDVWRIISYWGIYSNFFKTLISGIDVSTVSPKLKTIYEKWTK